MGYNARRVITKTHWLWSLVLGYCLAGMPAAHAMLGGVSIVKAMPGQNAMQVYNEAANEAATNGTVYKSPATAATIPAEESFQFTYDPSQTNTSALAILSDDGCRVDVGEDSNPGFWYPSLLERYGQGQSLSQLNDSFHYLYFTFQAHHIYTIT